MFLFSHTHPHPHTHRWWRRHMHMRIHLCAHSHTQVSRIRHSHSLQLDDLRGDNTPRHTKHKHTAPTYTHIQNTHSLTVFSCTHMQHTHTRRCWRRPADTSACRRERFRRWKRHKTLVLATMRFGASCRRDVGDAMSHVMRHYLGMLYPCWTRDHDKIQFAMV